MVLERCATEPLPRGCVNDGLIVDTGAVAGAVQRILRQSRSRAKRAVLAIPVGAVISREITLPASLNEREMEEQVEAEASQYVPFALDEINLDFCVLGASKSSDEEVDVMMVASRRERVDALQSIAEEAGVELEAIDVDAFAARRALERFTAPIFGGEALLALLDVRGGASALRVLRGDKVLHERELLIGGDSLSQEIARYYGISVEEAEAHKCRGDLPEDPRDGVLSRFAVDFAQEVESALHLFFTSTTYTEVDGVLLSGGGAVAGGMCNAVQAATGFSCQVVDPFHGMTLSAAAASHLGANAPRYLTACGLAMRRFVH